MIEQVPTVQDGDRPSERLLGLDAGRGLVALAVTLSHGFDAITTKTQFINYRVFNLGLFGIVAFFLLSGYVISISLDRTNSLKEFWVTRFFRLFPAFWISLVFAGIWGAVRPNKHIPSPEFAADYWPNFLWNCTMLAEWFGKPLLNPVSWTLGFELLFYVISSIAVACGFKKWPQTLLWILIGSLALHSIPAIWDSNIMGQLNPDITKHRTIHIFKHTFYFGSFLIGAFAYQYTKKSISTTHFISGLAAFWGVALSGWTTYLYRYWYPQAAWPNTIWAIPPMHIFSLFLGHMFILFLIFFPWKNVPKSLLYLGSISYSLYLFHLPALQGLPVTAVPIRTLIWLIFMVPTVVIVYHFVEVPCINMAKKIRKRMNISRSTA